MNDPALVGQSENCVIPSDSTAACRDDNVALDRSANGRLVEIDHAVDCLALDLVTDPEP